MIFKPLKYSVPPPGAVDDPGNRWDTPATIAEIDEHDAVFERVCGKEE